MLRTHQDMRDRLRTRILDITVDEAQDTNGGQYRLLRQIAGTTVVMVGDDDQGIYSFRGARPRNLRDFKEEFSPIEYRLERNYRSLPGIVEPAARLIRLNRDRLEKNPRPVRPCGNSIEMAHPPRRMALAAVDAPEDLRFIRHPSGERMGEHIAATIQAQIDRGIPPSEIAVLYRVNAMVQTLEPALLRFRIPYWVKDSAALLDRPAARILVGIARLCNNPTDEPALRRLIDLIPGVGEGALCNLVRLAAQNPAPGLLEAAKQLRPSALQTRLISLRVQLGRLHEAGPSHILAWAFSHGMREWIEKQARVSLRSMKITDTHPEYATHLDRKIRWYCTIVKEVQCAIDARIKDTENLLDQWSNALEILCDSPTENDPPKVTLTTVHGAKGLEWTVVHVAGFSEGLMPLTPHDSETIMRRDLEEERRLAYVAMTRAKDHLFLHHPATITLNGRFFSLQGSRFVRECLQSAEPSACLQAATGPS